MLNMTQHAATADQLKAGVVEPSAAVKKDVQGLLTFDNLPSKRERLAAAKKLAEIAATQGAQVVMIGGAPWFMRDLEDALLARGIQPAYAFSSRASEEHHLPDGTVRKVQVFRHEGFIRP